VRRRRAAALAWLAAASLAGPRAGAHPMGNISTSHYAGLELQKAGVRVKYLLDFAEIPSFRELERVDPDRDDRVTPEEREAYLADKTREVLDGLRLSTNGRPLRLESTWSRVTFPPGEGGLSTVRVAWDLFARWPDALGDRNFLVWNDGNYDDRPGWKEIRITGLDGLNVARTSLRAQPASGELAEYPEEYLFNPPTDTKAWCLFGEGLTEAEAAGFEPPDERSGAPRSRGLVGLLEAEQLSFGVVVVSLLLAVLLGAAHALEPGHGKTVVAAYLVGSRGTVSQAVLLGLTVTFTHTFSVLLLGIGVLFLSRRFVPETLLPYLGLASGILIAVVGVSMLRARWRELRAAAHPGPHGHAHPHEHGDGHHPHAHRHEHAHDHGAHAHPHVHAPTDRPTLRGILALGISGGLVPCPAGIVVLLAAVALGRLAFGLLLIVAFSVGLAAVLVGVGILCVTARRLFDRVPASSAFARRLGVASALSVTAFGVALAVRSVVAPWS
jgi:ABC-type nickel/cobalt efflux system permease component RcnA